MALFGTPLETLSDEHAEEAVVGALLVWSMYDEQKALRIRFEQFLEALSKSGKGRGKKR